MKRVTLLSVALALGTVGLGFGCGGQGGQPEIALVRFFGTERTDVYVMNANGSGQRRLTRNRGWDGYPAWSPDGRRIAFDSERDGNSEIYVMNADGSAQRRLTRNSAQDDWPDWSE